MHPRITQPVAGAMLAVGIMAALSGCKVGPDYTPPPNNAPAAWNATEAVEPGSATAPSPAVLADTAWWKNFNDPTLIGLIDRAFAANHDLRLATERIVAARAERGIVAAAGLPSVGSGADYLRSRQSENTRNGNSFREDSSGSDRYSAGLDASWEIDVFGGIARSVEAAERDIEAIEENRRDVLVVLAAEVARNYIDVRGFQRRLVVTQRNIETQAETLELSESRFKAGLTGELDVAQARAQLETTRAVVPILERNVHDAIQRLAVLTGSAPGTLLGELLAPAPIPATPDAIVADLPSVLVERRPDIRRAEREIAAQTARIGIATSDLFPKFSLTGSFGMASSQIGTLADGDSRLWAIGPAVRWPIFQGGRIKSNIAVQESLSRQALIRYEQTVLNAFEDVENALVGFSREQVRRGSLARAVEASRRAAEISTQLYRAGLTDFQRVLNSQLALAVSEESLAASDQAVAQALIRLYKALGGGWEAVEVGEAGAQAREP